MDFRKSAALLGTETDPVQIVLYENEHETDIHANGLYVSAGQTSSNIRMLFQKSLNISAAPLKSKD